MRMGMLMVIDCRPRLLLSYSSMAASLFNKDDAAPQKRRETEFSKQMAACVRDEKKMRQGAACTSAYVIHYSSRTKRMENEAYTTTTK